MNSPEQPQVLESLTCEECEELLPLVADGVLDETDDPALFEHLARCPACQASLAAYDRMDFLLEAAVQPKPISFPQRMYRVGAWLAAAAVLLAGGWLTLRPTGSFGTGQSSTVVRIVEQPNGDQAIVVRHPDGSVEVVDDLDQPRRDASASAAEELRPATIGGSDPKHLRPADR